MRGSSGVALAVAFALIVAGAGAPVVVGASGAAAPEDPGGGLPGAELLQTGEVEPDGVTMRAELEPDGDAAWTISYRIRLATDNETEAFESLRTDIQRNTSRYVDRFARRMNATVATAENATGRDMAATDFRVTTRTQQLGSDRFGFVTYHFRWANFARVEGDRIVAGDAVAGLYLDDATTFVIAWPADYSTRRVAPEPVDIERDNAVGWEGPRSFGTGEPTVAVAPASALPVPPLLLVAVLAVLVVAGIVVRRRGLLGGDAGLETGDAAGDVATDAGGGGGSGGGGGGGAGADTAAETGESAAAGGGATDDAGAVAAEEGDDEPPEELLSPQERVLRLLRDNGGRMKQKDVTESMDWSAARTSQVVSDLRDDGAVESFRLGRENVLRLPDDDEGLGPDE